MLCPNCKTENTKDEKNCINCGEPLPVIQEEIEPVKDKATTLEDIKKRREQKKKRQQQTKVVIICIISIAVIGIASGLIYWGKSAIDRTKTEDNLVIPTPTVTLSTDEVLPTVTPLPTITPAPDTTADPNANWETPVETESVATTANPTSTSKTTTSSTSTSNSTKAPATKAPTNGTSSSSSNKATAKPSTSTSTTTNKATAKPQPTILNTPTPAVPTATAKPISTTPGFSAGSTIASITPGSALSSQIIEAVSLITDSGTGNNLIQFKIGNSTYYGINNGQFTDISNKFFSADGVASGTYNNSTIYTLTNVVPYPINDYVIPISSTTVLTEGAVLNLSQAEIYIAKNEIYARHGRVFKKQELQDYFNSKTWYSISSTYNYSDDSTNLNPIEQQNVRFLNHHLE